MKTEDNSKIKNKPWPTKDAMDQVYKMNFWGSNGSKFYSGIGSHHSKIVEPYIDVITSFLTEFEYPLIVCDLGCGDFNIGKQLVSHTKNYIAIDIVSDLIEHNREKFKRDSLEFYCLDIAKDELPKGDCAILRQVLQHLSNDEVKCILKKLDNFKYIIITEHIPEGEFEPNKEIISGQGTRLKNQSGLDLLAAPFDLKHISKKHLLTIQLDEFKGKIVTMLYTN